MQTWDKQARPGHRPLPSHEAQKPCRHLPELFSLTKTIIGWSRKCCCLIKLLWKSRFPNFHLSSEASKESGRKAKFCENSATVVGVSSSNLVRYVFTVALYILFFIAEQWLLTLYWAELRMSVSSLGNRSTTVTRSRQTRPTHTTPLLSWEGWWGWGGCCWRRKEWEQLAKEEDKDKDRDTNEESETGLPVSRLDGGCEQERGYPSGEQEQGESPFHFPSYKRRQRSLGCSVKPSARWRNKLTQYKHVVFSFLCTLRHLLHTTQIYSDGM